MRRSFTFLEMVIVAAILALVSVFALPRLASAPRRLLVESALTSIRQAINETATRARATGVNLALTLDVDDNVMQVSACNSDLPQEWTPNAPTTAQESNNGLQFIANLDKYELPSDLEWLPEETGLDASEGVTFSFFADGQAAGSPIRFKIWGHQFQLDVDKLTGAPLIENLTP